MDSEDIIPSSQEASDAIKPINRTTVHKICSGQVVLNLAIAVKELVENAIDAGATNIDIRLKEYGSELIEVGDNGKGVEKAYFQALTLKHYTSKIREFSDLETIGTLGFRGEALSSLCALSDLSVLTKHSSSKYATKLKYDKNGKIAEEVIAAREEGTTVILENLFESFPVRRNEFMKNLKREFNKMCQLLYAYCLVCKGIRFTCTNLLKSGSKNTILSTTGATTVRENIIDIFSTKQLSSLIDVEIVKPNDTILEEYTLTSNDSQTIPFEFEFLISGVTHGSGRSATDRQFFFINSRPCEPTKIIKLINSVYRQYNSNQYPFVYLNIKTTSTLVDVNVTPDKRQVFLEKEKLLLATIKAALLEAFKLFPSTYKMENVDLTQNSTILSYFGDEEQKQRGLKRSASESLPTPAKKGSLLERFKKRSKTETDKDKVVISKKSKSNDDESEKLNESLGSVLDMSVEDRIDSLLEIGNSLCDDSVVEETTECALTPCAKPRKPKIVTVSPESRDKTETVGTKKNDKKASSSTPFLEFIKNHLSQKSLDEKDKNKKSPETPIKEDPPAQPPQRKTIPVNITMAEIKSKLAAELNAKQKEKNTPIVKFRGEICPENNKTAEQELERHFTKENFKNMEVIGQFNLGFIIAKLENDLFIVDQHASDEKYNFEQLQANTVMEHQVLVKPKQLELTAANESILIENEDIFKKNGFTFRIDHSAPCTKKVALTGVPMSKNYIFGKDDIDEMLFMLQDSNRIMCRPSRIRGMFAMRACRKSVMVGKHLTHNEMKKLLVHMSEIEQPWNCPHGRPTMRHLINLNLIDEDATRTEN